jgi:hypothetical protein
MCFCSWNLHLFRFLPRFQIRHDQVLVTAQRELTEVGCINLFVAEMYLIIVARPKSRTSQAQIDAVFSIDIRQARMGLRRSLLVKS